MVSAFSDIFFSLSYLIKSFFQTPSLIGNSPWQIAMYVLYTFLNRNNDVNSCADSLCLAIIKTPDVSLSSL